MQPIKQLTVTLEELAGPESYLFTLDGLSGADPDLSAPARKALIGRAVKSGLLMRVCRGLYLYPKVAYPYGLVLYHAVARLRAGDFNYISLESALSDAGIISQIPMNWITIMSTGRSYIYNCGSFGHIECVHTKKAPGQLADNVSYDFQCRMWRASVKLALQDMVKAKRNLDLVDMEVARELI